MRQKKNDTATGHQNQSANCETQEGENGDGNGRVMCPFLSSSVSSSSSSVVDDGVCAFIFLSEK